MTVVATMISSHYTVHASDSFLTTPRADGTIEPVETSATKIVAVPHWRGAFSYYGLAASGNWSTLEWLRERAARAGDFDSPEDFAHDTACRLQEELRTRGLWSSRDDGIGMHFSAYETVDGIPIPELFHIGNFEDGYGALKHDVTVTRETYATALRTRERLEHHGDRTKRLEVRRLLEAGAILTFNNGDPWLFNPVAASVFDTMRQIHGRGWLRAFDVDVHLEMVRRPVEIVSALLSSFAREGAVRIGGDIHALAIAPTGEMTSRTGDG